MTLVAIIAAVWLFGIPLILIAVFAWCRREATRLVVAKLELALLLPCDVVIPEDERLEVKHE